MKKSYIIGAVLALTMCQTVSAQTFQTGFFLDNYYYTYRINPAIASEKTFISGVIGDVTASMSSDLGLGSFLFKGPNGGLVTGLNSSVSSEEFLGKLNDANNFGVNLNYNLLSRGKWKNDHKFKTFEINVRGSASAGVPKDLFAFLKNGSQDKGFDLSGFNASAKAYAEVAWGRTLVGRNITLGWRVKGLVGLANFGLDVNKAAVTVNKDAISYNIDAQMLGAVGGLSVGTKVSENTGNKVLDFNSLGFNTSQIRPSGYGAAIDLGASYTFFNRLTVSASVVDLGAISWKYNFGAKTSGQQEFSGVENLDMDSDNVGDDMTKALDQLKGLAEFQSVNVDERKMEWLPAMSNIGVKFRVFNCLSVGYLGSFSFGKYADSWADNRLGATLTPFKWFSVSGNMGKNSFGDVIGAAASVNLLGFNLHVGCDGFRGKLGKINNIPVPVDSFRMSVNAGLTWTFGERHAATHHVVRNKAAKAVKAAKAAKSAKEVIEKLPEINQAAIEDI